MTTTAVVTAPTLEQVADYIQDRTLAVSSPGTETYLGTFTADTTPTDLQAGRLIGEAVSHVQTRLGHLIDTTLASQATSIAAVRAAALIELAYPQRAGDLSTYDRLIAMSDAALLALQDLNTSLVGAATSSAQTLLPQFAFPAPVLYGDQVL